MARTLLLIRATQPSLSGRARHLQGTVSNKDTLTSTMASKSPGYQATCGHLLLARQQERPVAAQLQLPSLGKVGEGGRNSETQA